MQDTQEFELDAPGTVNLMGIDPGTNTMGYCVLQVDIETLEVTNALAWTVRGEKLLAFSDWNAQLYHERFARIEAHKANLARTLRLFQPLQVACEAPFYSRLRPTAYGTLLEVVHAIQYVMYEWNSNRPLYMIDVLSGKAALGAEGKAIKGPAEKERIMRALRKHTELQFEGTTDLDEHATDATGVAFAQLLRLRKSDFALVTEKPKKPKKVRHVRKRKYR